MKLRYKIEQEDLIAFNRYHVDHSPALVRTKRFYMWGIPTALIISSVLLANFFDPLTTLFIGGISAIFFAISFNKTWYKACDKQVIKLYGEGL